MISVYKKERQRSNEDAIEYRRERSAVLLKQTQIRKLILSEDRKGDKVSVNYRISLPIEWIRKEGLEAGGYIKILWNERGGLCIDKLKT